MILTSLLMLAMQSGEMDQVIGRYKSFMSAHPTLSVDVAISGIGVGKGVMTLHRVGSAVKVDWQSNIQGTKFRFICDGKTCIDEAISEGIYDRLPAVDGPFPGGRIINAFGFPYPIVTGNTPFAQAKSATVLTHKGNLVELKATEQAAIGLIVITADFAPNGQLTRYSVEKGPAEALKAEVCEFSNYRFGSAAVPSQFDASPPIGFAPHAFDLPQAALETNSKMPPIRLSGSSETTLTAVVKKPVCFLAFVDDPMPAGLEDSLVRLNSSVPVTVIALKGSGARAGNLPRFEANNASFDAAGISVTPQFYLVKGGKLVQAWQGFQKSGATSFEHEVATFLAR